MTTGTLTGNERFEHTDSDVHVERNAAKTRVRPGRLGLGTAGVVAVLASAWGGIVPFVGPIFNFSGDGSGSWHWNLAHAVLALAPGAAGVLLGLFVIAESRGIVVGKGRLSLATAGTLLMVCGAWFAIGPLAWPVLSNSGTYFAASSHLRLLAYEVGYSIGVGLVLVVCGAFVDGWASRHQPKATMVRQSGVTEPSATGQGATGPVESGI
ncbi:MAG TPA: hypothetical protein VIY26_13715 [Acidimicrobiales bacterium]